MVLSNVKYATRLSRDHKVKTTRESLNASADLLRVVADGRTPAFDKIREALTLIVTGHGPSTVMAQTGMSRSELSEFVKGIGRRYRVRGENLPDNTLPVLFPMEPDFDVIQKFRKPKRERLMREAAEMRAKTPLPLEWDIAFPTEAGVRNAVAALRSKIDVDANLQSIALRYAASVQAPASTLVTYPLLRAVWQVTHYGQFERLAVDDSVTPRAAQSIVLAYDALEAARADGVDAFEGLRSTSNIAELPGLAVRARPLAEAAIARLESTLLMSKSLPHQARALRMFREETELVEMPAHVGELNDGQVHRIAHLRGLNTDGVPDPEVVAMERALREKGLEQDIPWLKGIWLAAYNTRRVDDFWKAVDRLLEGQPNWADSLQ